MKKKIIFMHPLSVSALISWYNGSKFIKLNKKTKRQKQNSKTKPVKDKNTGISQKSQGRVNISTVKKKLMWIVKKVPVAEL